MAVPRVCSATPSAKKFVSFAPNHTFDQQDLRSCAATSLQNDSLRCDPAHALLLCAVPWCWDRYAAESRGGCRRRLGIKIVLVTPFSWLARLSSFVPLPLL
ncbi:hypothetical protein IG631_18382 [Alternaria alternata]|nr:hypothetical protein IG631_18382 [Alternaria alternata]